MGGNVIADRFTRTITVRTSAAGAVDEYGTPTVDETTTDVVGHYRQLSADELGGSAEIGAQAWRVYLPAGTAVEQADRLTLDNGETLEVIGRAQELYDPRRRTVVAVVLRAEVAA